jgi:hypothetical protein
MTVIGRGASGFSAAAAVVNEASEANAMIARRGQTAARPAVGGSPNG